MYKKLNELLDFLVYQKTKPTMSFYEKCQYIRNTHSSDEGMAFEQLRELLIEYTRDYSCDEEFYLYAFDKSNNYKTFREKTQLLFDLLYDIIYDEEQIKEVSNDPTIKDELTKYWKFIESVQFIRKNIQTICFEEDSVEVRCFDKYMNYCKKYLETIYTDMKEMNNLMDELNSNMEKLADKIQQLST